MKTLLIGIAVDPWKTSTYANAVLEKGFDIKDIIYSPKTLKFNTIRVICPENRFKELKEITKELERKYSQRDKMN